MSGIAAVTPGCTRLPVGQQEDWACLGAWARCSRRPVRRWTRLWRWRGVCWQPGVLRGGISGPGCLVLLPAVCNEIGEGPSLSSAHYLSPSIGHSRRPQPLAPAMYCPGLKRHDWAHYLGPFAGTKALLNE